MSEEVSEEEVWEEEEKALDEVYGEVRDDIEYDNEDEERY